MNFEEADDDDEYNSNVVRYPCMPSLIALQQMRNRLHLARTGKKLMKWTTMATSKELRILGRDIVTALESYRERVRYRYILLARVRYFYPRLNDIVLENVPRQASCTTKTIYRPVVGSKIVHMETIDQEFDSYEHLGIDRGGGIIMQAKKAWRELLIRLLWISSLKVSFIAMEAANMSATKKENILKKVLIPKLKVTSRYIISELDEKEREDNFRLKRFKQLKVKRAALKLHELKKGALEPRKEIDESIDLQDGISLAKNILFEIIEVNIDVDGYLLAKQILNNIIDTNIETDKYLMISAILSQVLDGLPVRESISVASKVPKVVGFKLNDLKTPCGICKVREIDVVLEKAEKGDIAELAVRAYHTKNPSLTEVTNIYVQEKPLRGGEITDIFHNAKDNIYYEYYKAPPLNNLCDAYLKGLEYPNNFTYSKNPYYSRIPSLTRFYDIYVKTKAIPDSKTNNLSSEKDIIYFEQKYKEVIRLKKKKNIDGSVCEEKQVITVRTERRNPEKSTNNSRNQNTFTCAYEPPCNGLDNENRYEDLPSIINKSECVNHIHQMGDPAVRPCNSCEFQRITNKNSDVVSCFDLSPKKSSDTISCKSCEQNLVWMPKKSKTTSCESYQESLVWTPNRSPTTSCKSCHESLIWTPKRSRTQLPCKSCDDNLVWTPKHSSTSSSCQSCEETLVWAPKKRTKNTSCQNCCISSSQLFDKETTYESCDESRVHVWTQIKSKKTKYCKSCYDNFVLSKNKSDSQVSCDSNDDNLVWTPRRSSLLSGAKDFMWLNTLMINKTSMWPRSREVSSKTSLVSNETEPCCYSSQNNSECTSRMSNITESSKPPKINDVCNSVKSDTLSCKSCHENLIWTPKVSNTTVSCKSCQENFIWTPQKSKMSLSCKSCEENFIWTGKRLMSSISCSSCKKNFNWTQKTSENNMSCTMCDENTFWTPKRSKTTQSCGSCEDYVACGQTSLMTTLSFCSCEHNYIWFPKTSKNTSSRKSCDDNFVLDSKKSKTIFESYSNEYPCTSKTSALSCKSCEEKYIWPSKNVESRLSCETCDKKITWVPTQSRLKQTCQASKQRLVWIPKRSKNTVLQSCQNLACYPKDSKHLLSGDQSSARNHVLCLDSKNLVWTPNRSENTLSCKSCEEHYIWTQKKSNVTMSRELCNDNPPKSSKRSQNSILCECSKINSNFKETMIEEDFLCKPCEERHALYPKDSKHPLSGNQVWTHTLLIGAESIWPRSQSPMLRESEKSPSRQSRSNDVISSLRCSPEAIKKSISCESYEEEFIGQLRRNTLSGESRFLSPNSINHTPSKDGLFWANTLWVDDKNAWYYCVGADEINSQNTPSIQISKNNNSELTVTKSCENFECNSNISKKSCTFQSYENNLVWIPKSSRTIFLAQSSEDKSGRITKLSQNTLACASYKENLASTHKISKYYEYPNVQTLDPQIMSENLGSCQSSLLCLAKTPKLSKTALFQCFEDKAWTENYINECQPRHDNYMETLKRSKSISSYKSGEEDVLWAPDTLSCKSCEEIHFRTTKMATDINTSNSSREHLNWLAKRS